MKRIFRKSAAVLLSALMLILGMMPCASAFQVPTAAEIVDRTDLTPEDYYGTWNMTYMMLEGNMVPVEILGLTSSIAIQDEMITFTDTFGQVKQYDTFFQDGHLHPHERARAHHHRHRNALAR